MEANRYEWEHFFEWPIKKHKLLVAYSKSFLWNEPQSRLKRRLCQHIVDFHCQKNDFLPCTLYTQARIQLTSCVQGKCAYISHYHLRYVHHLHMILSAALRYQYDWVIVYSARNNDAFVRFVVQRTFEW